MIYKVQFALKIQEYGPEDADSGTRMGGRVTTLKYRNESLLYL